MGNSAWIGWYLSFIFLDCFSHRVDTHIGPPRAVIVHLKALSTRAAPSCLQHHLTKTHLQHLDTPPGPRPEIGNYWPIHPQRHSRKYHLLQASRHGLSQQGVWVPFWTPKPLKRSPQDTQILLCGISKNLKLIIEFVPLLIIPMTLLNDIMSYFDEFINVYGWNMSILWSPLKIWTPQNFTTANFRHPVSKSWLRHCKQEQDMHMYAVHMYTLFTLRLIA